MGPGETESNMEKIKELEKIQEIYQQGGNLMEYFRQQDSRRHNDTASILISYDLQAGSYIASTRKRPDYTQTYTGMLADILRPTRPQTVLEAGVGEATTLRHVAEALGKDITYYGFDLSWSRVRYAQYYCQETPELDIRLFTGDLFQAPLLSNSIDVVYTSHTIEPNRGRETEALRELYRIARKHLVLLEPCYELASEEAQKRMDHHGYVKGLQEAIGTLGYKVVRHELFPISSNPLNPTGLTIIEKNPNPQEIPLPESPYACPVTQAPLALRDACFYAEKSLLAYPVLQTVPCLLAQNAIVASHLQDF